jgi:hypothetical protein
MFVDQGDGTFENFHAKSAAHYDRVPLQQAITPTKEQ